MKPIGLVIACLWVGTAMSDVKIAYLGDQGVNDHASRVLKMVHNEKAELLVVLGDFDYQEKPDKWIEQIDQALGKNFPVAASVGNHDLSKWPIYKKILDERIQRTKDLTCTGEMGIRASCFFRGVRILLSGVGILGTGHAEYLGSELTKAKEAWKVCAWHKNQRLLQTEDKSDETGWGVFEACRRGGAMVVNGHAHIYSRTHLLSAVNPPTVKSSNSEFALTPDTTLVVVSGLGGKSIRQQNDQLAKNPWWASVYTRSQKANPGAFFCSYQIDTSPTRADCYFKDISGKIPDRFTMLGSK
jgi:hypothetical protein